MTLSLALSLGVALLQALVLPLVWYLVARRDKELDALREDLRRVETTARQGREVLHKKVDELERVATELRVAVAGITGSLAGVQSTVNNGVTRREFEAWCERLEGELERIHKTLERGAKA